MPNQGKRCEYVEYFLMSYDMYTYVWQNIDNANMDTQGI